MEAGGFATRDGVENRLFDQVSVLAGTGGTIGPAGLPERSVVRLGWVGGDTLITAGDGRR